MSVLSKLIVLWNEKKKSALVHINVYDIYLCSLYQCVRSIIMYAISLRMLYSYFIVSFRYVIVYAMSLYTLGHGGRDIIV